MERTPMMEDAKSILEIYKKILDGCERVLEAMIPEKIIISSKLDINDHPYPGKIIKTDKL